MNFEIDFRKIPKKNQGHLRLLFEAGLLNKYMYNLKNSKFSKSSIEISLYESCPIIDFVDVFWWSYTAEGYSFWQRIPQKVSERLQR